MATTDTITLRISPASISRQVITVATGDLEADNITDYHIDVASNQRYEDIMPEVRLVEDAPVVGVPIVEPARDYDSGPSIQEVAEPDPTPEPAPEPTQESAPDPIEYDWTGQEYWLYT